MESLETTTKSEAAVRDPIPTAVFANYVALGGLVLGGAISAMAGESPETGMEIAEKAPTILRDGLFTALGSYFTAYLGKGMYDGR